MSMRWTKSTKHCWKEKKCSFLLKLNKNISWLFFASKISLQFSILIILILKMIATIIIFMAVDNKSKNSKNEWMLILLCWKYRNRRKSVGPENKNNKQITNSIELLSDFSLMGNRVRIVLTFSQLSQQNKKCLVTVCYHWLVFFLSMHTFFLHFSFFSLSELSRFNHTEYRRQH